MSPEEKRIAWKSLTDAVYRYEASRAAWDYKTKGPWKDAQAQTDLIEAACQVALMKGYRPPADPAAPRGATSGLTFGFGRNRGKTPAEVDDRDLAWYANTLAENVADPSKARWAEANQALLDAVEEEIGNRRRGEP